MQTNIHSYPRIDDHSWVPPRPAITTHPKEAKEHGELDTERIVDNELGVQVDY